VRTGKAEFRSPNIETLQVIDRRFRANQSLKVQSPVLLEMTRAGEYRRKPEKCPGGRNEGKTGHAQKILQCQGPVQPFLAWAFAGYITPVEPSQSAFMWRFGLVARFLVTIST
jgi:hypothetical protein